MKLLTQAARISSSSAYYWKCFWQLGGARQPGVERRAGSPQVLEEQPPLSFAIPACLTGPDGITSLPKNNQTEPISRRNTTQRHRGRKQEM